MQSEQQPVITLRNLSFAYGTHQILHDISMDIYKGQIVGLLGPNGSGKSTILKLISGTLESDTGCIKIKEENIKDLDRKDMARKIAMVPQESMFSFPFSVLEVVIMGRYPYLDGLMFESDKDIVIAREALSRCGASHLADRIIHELSSGERQRIVFARALAQQPEILLLDEPVSFLDIKYQVELYDIVRALAKEQQCTILTVLHDLNLAAEYCNKIYLLSSGRIKSGGLISEVLTYANLQSVFDTNLFIDTNTLTGKPVIIPLSKDVGTKGAG